MFIFNLREITACLFQTSVQLTNLKRMVNAKVNILLYNNIGMFIGATDTTTSDRLIVIHKVALEKGVVCALVEVVLFVIFIVGYPLSTFYDTYILLIDKSIHIIALLIIYFSPLKKTVYDFI